MGADASSMPMGDPNMAGGDPNMMGGDPTMGTDPDGGVVGEQGAPGDPNAMVDPNAPVMGANPFDGGEGGADVSGDPEKKAESLAGQLASIIRNHLGSDGIDKHEDKKKEIMGMVASAIVDGMDDNEKNSMIEYLSDKLNGAGESDGDEPAEDNDDMSDDPNADMSGDMGSDPTQQQMMESIINEVITNIVKEKINPMDVDKNPKNLIQNDNEQGYRATPYKRKK